MEELVKEGKRLTDILIQSPGMALGDPGSWVGYAFIEMASDLGQEWAESMAPIGWEDASKSVVRGFMSDVKMNYANLRRFENAQGVATNFFASAGGIFGPTANQ